MTRLSLLQHIVFAVVVMAVTCSSFSFSQEPGQSPLFHPWTWERDHYRQHLRNLPATTDSNFTVLGRWAWGPCQAVDVRDDFAYIGNGPTFHVLDVSDPRTPTIVGEYVADWLIYDIRLRDTLAFVATEATLLILNVSNPQQPTRVGEIFISSGPTRVAPVDSFAYVATYLGTLRIVDVSNPAAPYFRGVIAVGGERPWCLAARGRYVYVGNVEPLPFLAIVDARNPDVPTRTLLNIGGPAFSADVRDSSLFLSVLAIPSFRIYDVSNPGSPVLTGQVHVPFPAINALTVHDQVAFVSTKDSGIAAIDITNLQQPQIRDVFRERVKAPGGIFTALAAQGAELFVANYDGLRTLNISNIDSLREVSFFPTGGTAEKIFVRDSLAYVASGYSGLWILDVSDPQQPRPVSNILTGGGYASDVVVEDSVAYLVNWVFYTAEDTARGLWAVSIANPAQPRILSHHPGIARYPNIVALSRLAIQDHLLLMSQPSNPTNDMTLEIIDVRDPVQPNSVNIVRGQYSLVDIALRDSIAYLARSDSGLKILDLRDPLHPPQISSVLNDARGVVPKDSLLYVNRIDTFFVIDASELSSPLIVGRVRISSGNSLSDLAIAGNYVYSAEGLLVAVDVSNPISPLPRALFQKKYWRGGVDANGPIVYLADGTYGVLFIRNDLVTSIREPNNPHSHRAFVLLQNYPNPFNPTTEITYKIREQGLVNLKVYDVLGREVATLVNEIKQPGTHSTKWNSAGSSSGVYFYRLQAGDFTQTKKLIVLR